MPEELLNITGAPRRPSEWTVPLHEVRTGPEAEGLEAILDAALTIWGPERMELPHIAVCASVVVGDLARLARRAVEVGPVNGDDIARELGNMIVSAVRWAHDLDLDPDSCVAAALVAQAAYVERRGGGQHG